MRLLFLPALALCALPPALPGQAFQSVVQRVFNDSSSPGSSVILNNVGQTQHLVTVNLTETGGSCNTTVVMNLQGSSDNATWFNLTPSIQTNIAFGPVDTTATANGSFPFLRVFVQAGFSAPCRFTVWYIGTVATFSNPQSFLASKAYRDTDSTHAAGITSSIEFSPGAAFTPVLYGVVVSNPDAVNPLMAVISTVGTACTGTITGSMIVRIPANASSLVFPTSTVPYMTGAPGDSLCVNLTGSLANAEVRSIYRFE